jgi:hypothetical protein
MAVGSQSHLQVLKGAKRETGKLLGNRENAEARELASFEQGGKKPP